ncbi:MogA/MoaB family molybdenum cofactor biosynthesis protein [Luteipulveratus halotolerans]|uniref:Molybdenum cofactor synthesis protein n=1 Tax=Luteipulveratus halotolerans TaxID=1631356 RepID=A0A0L6CPC1_9MICO|nr:molybdenum cofactor synthesis domain-containing protein [Luteipulveratus halotolerans]KNX39490.1 molybdenum cofactor synthesis protein [Luteipulveratus halotolerans]
MTHGEQERTLPHIEGGRRAVVVTCSTRAAAGTYADRTGPLIVEALRDWGLTVREPVVVADGAPVEAALRVAVAEGAALVITTGGTGLTPTDRTPEATAAVVDRPVPGIAEAIRAAGVGAGVPTAMLSRGTAGLAGHTLVVNLPGSTGGVRDGLAVLQSVIAHALDQIAGGDH